MLVDPFFPFLLFVLALYATPGPGTLSLAASGSAFGFRKSTLYSFGTITGIILTFSMTAIGLGLLFTKYPTIHLIFKWVGFIYILYLAYKIAMASSVNSSSGKKINFWHGILLTLLNPKAYFAAMATVSQFTKQGEEYYLSFVIILAWITILTIIINFIWISAGSLIGSKIASTGFSTELNIIFSILLVGSVVISMFL